MSASTVDLDRKQKQVSSAKVIKNAIAGKACGYSDKVGQGMAIADPLQAQPADLLRLNHLAGNQAVNRMIQAKLRVGAANDIYEREADRKASEIVSSPAAEDVLQPKSKQPSIEDESLRMKANNPLGEGFETEADLEKRIRQQTRAGSSLPTELRSFMEKRFQSDFKQVRIHQDEASSQLNDQINAQAFTHGKHVFFNAGQFQPSTHSGQRLLAHELTHVVQQSGGSAPNTVQRLVGLDYLRKKWSSQRGTPPAPGGSGPSQTGPVSSSPQGPAPKPVQPNKPLPPLPQSTGPAPKPVQPNMPVPPPPQSTISSPPPTRPTKPLPVPPQSTGPAPKPAHPNKPLPVPPQSTGPTPRPAHPNKPLPPLPQPGGPAPKAPRDYSQETGLERAIGKTEHEGVGMGLSLLDATGNSIGLGANDKEGNSDADKQALQASSGMGIITGSAQTLLSGASALKSGMGGYRAYQLYQQASAANGGKGSRAQMSMARRLARRSAIGGTQAGLGMASGITGITSSALGLDENKGDASSTASGVGGAISTASSLFGGVQSSISYYSGHKRKQAAQSFTSATRQDESDPSKQVANSELTQRIAQQVKENQGLHRKRAGIAGNVLSGASGIFGMAKGFGKLTGGAGDAVGTVGMLLGLGGSMLSGISSLVSKRKGNEKVEKQKAAVAAMDAKITEKQAEIGQLEQDITPQSASLTQLETLQKEIEEKIAEQTKDKGKATSDKTAIEAQLAKLAQELQKLNKQISEAKAKIDEAKAKLAQAKTALTSLEDQKKSLNLSGMAVDPDAAAEAIRQEFEKADESQIDKSLINFVEKVLGIPKPVEFVKSDPEMAQQIIKEKINKTVG